MKIVKNFANVNWISDKAYGGCVRENSDPFRLGDWLVEPELNRLSRASQIELLEAKAMDVLAYLATHTEHVVSTDELLDAVWTGRFVEPAVVHRRINQIRHALGDDPRSPEYIRTIPRRGYQVVAHVSTAKDHPVTSAVEPEPVRMITRRSWIAPGVGAILLVVGGLWLWLWLVLPESTPTAGIHPLTRIAVLPFDDLSAEGDQSWLATGIAEDLIDALSRIEGLRIPARRSTALLKSQGADLRTIGERLAVGSVVEGSVRREGDQLLVLARWIRIDDRSQLWSRRYDREFKDILNIQKEIAIGVAEAIRTELNIQDAPVSILAYRYSTSDARAWELYKKALPLSLTLEPSKLEEAREMLLRAIEYDPAFVAARVRLSVNDYMGNSESVEMGVDGLKSALTMDPYNPRALSMLAWDSAMRFWDYQTAERLLNRIPEMERSAVDLNIAYQVYANTGRLKEALRAAEGAVQLDPMWAPGHCQVARLHQLRGDVETAASAYERGISIAQETTQYIWGCAYYYAVMRGREVHSEGRKLLETLQTRGFDVWSCDFYRFAREGDVESMYECLISDFEATDINTPAKNYAQTIQRQRIGAVRQVPLFMPYHDEPRFQAFLQSLDDRMAQAAGTYEAKVGLQLPP